MEGLRKLTLHERREGRLQGIKITDQCIISHLLFVDDVLIFLNGGISEFSVFSAIMQRFFLEIGLESIWLKSTISFPEFSPQEIWTALQKLPFQRLYLGDGLKYVGFCIKPHSYKIEDWIWIVAKMEKILHNWNHRFLSRAGRLVLIKAILEATLIY